MSFGCPWSCFCPLSFAWGSGPRTGCGPHSWQDFSASLYVPLLCLTDVLPTCAPSPVPPCSLSCTRVLRELLSIHISLLWLVAFDIQE